MPFPFPFTMFGANRSSNSGGGGVTCDFTYCYGGDWVQGKVGNYGMHFNGDASSGFVSINNPSSLELSQGTIAGWIRRGLIGERTTLISLGQANDSANVNANWMLEIGPAFAEDKLYMTVGDGINYAYVKTDATINDTDWHHIAGSFTNNARDFVLYIDGVSQSLTLTTDGGASGFTPAIAGSQEANLGVSMRLTAYGRYLTGSMDEVAVWDVPLTPAQISLLSTGSARADSITPPLASTGSWATGKLDTYSLDFDGVNDYVDLPFGATSGSSNGQSGSVAAWIYTDVIPSPSGYPVIFGASKSTSTTDQMRLGISTNASYLNNLQFASRIGSTWGPFVYATNGGTNNDGKVVVGEWTHVVWTSDGTTTSMYLNGTASTIVSNGTGPTGRWFGDMGLASGYNVQLGGIQYGGTNPFYPFNGKMDEVGAWSEVLNLGGVQALYNDGVGVKANTVSSSYLVSYYDMEDGFGTTLTDRTANGYDGTLEDFSDTGTTGSLLMYYDFEIGDNNPVSGNFPTSLTVYDNVDASFHPSTAHTGTMTNMSVADFGSWDQGKIGKYSLNFSGGVASGESVEVANNSAINFTDDMTVAGWVYSSNQTFLQGFVAKEQSAGVTHNGWILGRDTSGGTLHPSGHANKFYWTIRNGSYDAGKNVFSDDAGPNGGWAHLVGTRRNGDNYLYVNGIQQADTSNQSTIGATTCALRLGQWWDQSDAYPLVGNLDEVSIWSGSLSDANIDSLHSGSKANAITASAADVGVWVTGKVDDYALHFDGVNDYVDLPLGAGTGSTSDGTSGSLTCWINPDTISSYPTIFGGGNNTGGNNDYFEYFLKTTDSNRLGLAIYRNGVSYGSTVATAGGLSGNGSISTGAWQHVCVVGNGTNFTFYINGTSSVTTGAGWFSSMSTDYLQAHIGALPWSSGIDYEFDGKIDEFAFWDEPLSAQSILDLYNSGSGAKSNSITPTAEANASGDWSAGKVDTYSLTFPGGANAEYVDIPDNSSIQFGNNDDLTVACWVSSSADSSYQGFVSKKASAAANYAGWTLFRTTDNKMGVSIGSAASPRVIFYTDSAPDATWHHLVMTRNGTSKATALWLDGVEQAGSTTAPLDDSGGNMRLAQWWTYNTSYCLNGKLDEVAIWDVELNSGAIAALYNSGTGVKANTVSSSALVDYYDMEDGPGSSTLTDQSSNTNNGTLTGMDDGVAPFGTPKLISYYDMEDGPGSSTLTDQTANGYNGTLTNMDNGSSPATLAAYLDFECNGPGNSIAKDLSGNDLSGTLRYMKTGSCS